MRIRVLAAAAAGLLALVACSESPTAPARMQPGARSNDEITCRAGYVIATNSDGSQTCVPDGSATMSAPAASDTTVAPTTP